MKYIIMADGYGTRWKNYNNIPKHLIEIGGETLLARTVRLLKEAEPECSITITSHNPKYEVPGAVRYEPQNNVLELDRFTVELLEDDVCFLYGDTYYTDSAMAQILSTPAQELMFFGNTRSIVAVKVHDAKLFRQHFDRVRQLFLDGKIQECKGWQIYQSYANLPFGERVVGPNYVLLKDETRDINSPQELNP